MYESSIYTTEEGDYYVLATPFSGSSYSTVLWKNDEAGRTLPGGSYAAGTVRVSESGDVYATGASGNRAVIWKNGVAQQLSSISSSANSVYLHGDDVYVGGSITDGGVQKGVVWKNGQIVQTLEPEAGYRNNVSEIFVK